MPHKPLRDDSAFDHVDVFCDEDGQGYYTVIYDNGKKGPRSEGYADGLQGAHDAAERDFPELPIRTRVDTPD